MSEFPDVPWSDEVGQELKDDFVLADAGQGWHRIGKTEISLTRFIKWVNQQPFEVNFDEWKRLSTNQRSNDFQFKVDIAEFDEKAKSEGWDYSRRVTLKSQDWYKILIPSFELVFGKGSMSAKNYMATIGKVRGIYADWLDVPQSPDKNGNVPTNKDTGKPYTTLKLIKVFANREEAAQAYAELKSKSGVSSNTAASIYPSGWSSALEATIEWAKGLKLGPAELAKKLDLTNEKTSDGTPINIPLVVSEILDLPLEMVQEAFKEKLPY